MRLKVFVYNGSKDPYWWRPSSPMFEQVTDIKEADAVLAVFVNPGWFRKTAWYLDNIIESETLRVAYNEHGLKMILREEINPCFGPTHRPDTPENIAHRKKCLANYYRRKKEKERERIIAGKKQIGLFAGV